MSDYAYRIENDIYYTKQLHPQDAVFFCKKYVNCNIKCNTFE